MSLLLTDRIGAVLTAGGCFFRVWAPTAERVRVLLQHGTQWEWQSGTRVAELYRGTDGYWSGLVSQVAAGTLYRLELTHGGATSQRLDPAARDVVDSSLTRDDPHSHNASLVVDWSGFAWRPFVPPAFENYLLYQFHMGTFAGRHDHLGKDWATFADVQTKFGYLRELGFNAIEPLPIQEYAQDRSWGYNPASYFAPESSYGTPHDLRQFVDAAHANGLAVLFDVVYNHAGPGDNVLWNFDDEGPDGGAYFAGGPQTSWGPGPAWWKREVRDFFYQNARMYLEEYRADGLRFDVTTQIDGHQLAEVIDRLKREFPDRLLVAEHLPADPWIIDKGGFAATWFAKAHHECQRALTGSEPLARVKSILGWDGYRHPWNLVKYTAGSHDDVGDDRKGNAKDGLTNWDGRHRYLVDQLGGRDNGFARAKCRLAWALCTAMPGTPLMFMGGECLMGAPWVAWGYWHDGYDENGDHRFNWQAAGDPLGMEMRRLVAAANAVRWHNRALRASSLEIVHEDHACQILAFVREDPPNCVLTAVNLSDCAFDAGNYGLPTGGRSGQWTQILNSQEPAFGGYAGAEGAFQEPWTQGDGRIDVSLPAWSVVMWRRMS